MSRRRNPFGGLAQLLPALLAVAGVLIGGLATGAAASASGHSRSLAASGYTYDGVGKHAAATLARATDIQPLGIPNLRPATSVRDASTAEAASRFAAEAASPGTALVKYSYPPNRGFMGSPVRTTLNPGTVVDRYGANSGTFVSPQGTSFAPRSLPPSSLDKPFNTYEVVNPIDVHAGTVAPWFGQGGGGIQYEFGQSIADLIEGGFLKVVG